MPAVGQEVGVRQSKKIVRLDRKIAVRVPQALFDKLILLGKDESNQLGPVLRRLLSLGYAAEVRARGQQP